MKQLITLTVRYAVKSFALLFFVLVVLSISITGCGTNQGNRSPGNQQGQQPPQNNQEQGNQGQNAQQDNYIREGTYKIGTDLPSGEYILYSSEDFAYYEIAKDSTGDIESIIANDNFSGTRYVTAADGQYLQVKNARMLPVDKAPVQQPEEGSYKSGMYKAGRDIKPGEYKVVADGGTAYIEVRKDSLGGIEGIVTNDNFEGEKYITIKDNQYIKLQGCHIPVQ